MKVSILTFSKEYNYGANLQCYALSKVIESFGHHVELIDAQLKPLPASLITRLLRYPTERAFKNFWTTNLPSFTRKYNSLSELMSNPPKSDALIVGSDQVWNPDVTNRLDPMVYFFPYACEGQRRISYAASIGSSVWKHPELVSHIEKELKKFDAISVREDEAVELCKTTFGVDASVVLDPTLLLGKYDDICGSFDAARMTNELVLFKFVKDKDCDNACLSFARRHTLKPVHLTNRRMVKGFTYRPNASISQWLNTIRYADFVVADSFHCMVFCILFHKQFAILPSFKGRSGRMESLLRQLNLSDRFCHDVSDFNNRSTELYNSQIDYNLVETKINELRSQSLDFLKRALG